MERNYGAVEAGGTKFRCGVGTETSEWLAEMRIETTTPAETLSAVVDFFGSTGLPLQAVGVGSFGPLDLDPASPSFGRITTTPKSGWSGADILGDLRRALKVPIGLDTDVNAAALGEHRWGRGRGLGVVLYLTIGTGIGGGLVVDGRPVHGLVHPEMGHIRIPVEAAGDFPGVCPYHGNCFEGLASGPAVAARWGRPVETLPEGHPAWQIEAEIVAAALHGFVCTISPHRIILGGGVMQRQTGLFGAIRSKLAASLNGYVRSPALIDKLDEYVVPPALGDRAGLAGGLILAQRAAGAGF
ncbi:MAG TPA: ROK family protein [Anaerolineales bacterium]|nr:ROK family protein [Anaerolineales bacterium]